MLNVLRPADLVTLLCCLLVSGLGPAAAVAQDGISAGSTNCPHVRILTPAEADQVNDDYRGQVKYPGKYQKEVVQQALEVLPSIVCLSVRRVVFLEVARGEELAWVEHHSRPDLINISAVPFNASEERLDPKAKQPNIWPQTIHAIIHEAYHCATYLLERTTSGSSWVAKSDWPGTVLHQAEDVVAQARLQGGFLREWTRVHRAFAQNKYAAAYDEARVGRKQAPPKGFMTMYGGSKPAEDIAEMASWVLAEPFYTARRYYGMTPDDTSWQYACTSLQDHTQEGVPPKLVAVYTKLSFLLDLGFITEDDFDHCIGSSPIGLFDGNLGEGFHAHDSAGNPTRSYDRNVTARIGAFKPEGWTLDAGAKLFLMEADGKATVDGTTYPAHVRFFLRPGGDRLLNATEDIEDVSWPRGLYKLDNCAVRFRGKPAFNQYEITIETERPTTICSTAGQVLVTRATHKRIEGAIILQKAIRVKKLPFPETNGLPQRILFRISK